MCVKLSCRSEMRTRPLFSPLARTSGHWLLLGPPVLIAAGQSAAAVLEDILKAIQVKLYSKDDRDLACLTAIGIGGSRLLCALNRAGHLPSEDVSRGHCRLEPPLCPNQTPTAEFKLVGHGATVGGVRTNEVRAVQR